MSYIVGISSGIFALAKQQAAEGGLPFMGLARKASFALTKSVRFIQIDLESISEFNEPMIEEQMRKVREELKIAYGIHSEARAFGGELPYLDEAILAKYHQAHERIIRILKGAVKIKAVYVLIHSSESTPFLALNTTLQPLNLADFWGRPISVFLDENKELFIEWFKKPESDFFFDELFKEIFAQSKEAFLEKVISELIQTNPEYKKKLEEITKQAKTQEEAIKELAKLFPELQEKAYEILFDRVKTLLNSSRLTYGAEKFAYYLVAKWMEIKNDVLWSNIVNSSIEYYWRFDNKTSKGFEEVKSREEWLSKKGIKKFSIDDTNFRADVRLWVPAVSAKYIWGHFFPEKCPDYGSIAMPEDPKKIIDKGRNLEFDGFKVDLFFCLETPMSAVGIEEWTRFPNPVQMYWLVKEINKEKEYIAIAIDLEHLLSSNMDPEIIVDLLPEDAGNYIKVIHSGYPAVLQPAHIHIPIGTEQFFYLYQIYFKLRMKGMGKNNVCFLIFERASEQEIRYSVEALKIIAEHLEKDIRPEEIIKNPMQYKRFWGLDMDQPMSVERQKAIIRLHAYDPLRGLLTLPEEQYTFFGKAAVEKGKREEWRKEELK